MPHLVIDPLGGASGDMFLSALLDLGVPVEHLTSQLALLKLSKPFRIVSQAATNRHFAGTRTFVEIQDYGTWHKPEHQPKQHSHDHDHDHHHGHDHEHGHDHHHHGHHEQAHEHTSHKSIRHILESSGLKPAVIKKSLAVFHSLAEVEAQVHGKSIDDVSFHEVGAIDSIVDIVGSVLALDFLGIDKIYSTAVGISTGHVDCAHGKLPLPAPATALLLRGLPVVQTGETHETCTPTGAALLKTLASFDMPCTPYRIGKIGMGLCHSAPKSAPPYLRMSLITLENEPAHGRLIQEQLALLACNIDDMTPEYLSLLLDQLMTGGALDASIHPILMKKGRPGHEIQVLCALQSADPLQNFLLENSTTFGVRKSIVQRNSLPRRQREVGTPWGLVRVKEADLQDGRIKAHVEFDDVKAICNKHQIAWDEVLQAVHKARS